MIETDDIKVLCIPVTDKKEVGFQIIYHEYENDNAPCAFFLPQGMRKILSRRYRKRLSWLSNLSRRTLTRLMWMSLMRMICRFEEEEV